MKTKFFTIIMVVLIIGAIFININKRLNGAESPKKVLLAIGENWEPYYSQNLPKGGVVTEIVRSAFHRAGYKLDVKWLPWGRVMEEAREGICDGVLGGWFSKERTKFFVYSKPYFTNEIVLFKKKGVPITYNSIQDLKRYRVGVARDSGPHDFLKDVLPDKTLELATSADLNIQKLMGDRIDILADEKLNVQYIINTNYPQWRDSLEIIQPPLQVNHLHVMITKKNPNHHTIVDDFNKGLQQIVEDGTLNKILKEFGFPTQK